MTDQKNVHTNPLTEQMLAEILDRAGHHLPMPEMAVDNNIRIGIAAGALATHDVYERHRCLITTPGSLNDLRDRVHDAARANGWWDAPRPFPELLCLVHSEVSEALEEYRAGRDSEPYYGADGKPEGIPSELADVIIRVLDMCGHYRIDIAHVIDEKLAYNATRGHRHGGKAL